jgi:hypothetical protein
MEGGVYMKLIISENAITETMMCKKDFVCLSGEGACLCELTYCLNGKSYFINPDKDKLCNYKVKYGTTFLCGCPTRKEIYNRYEI